jgi:hypothetical protein
MARRKRLSKKPANVKARAAYRKRKRRGRRRRR